MIVCLFINLFLFFGFDTEITKMSLAKLTMDIIGMLILERLSRKYRLIVHSFGFVLLFLFYSQYFVD